MVTQGVQQAQLGQPLRQGDAVDHPDDQGDDDRDQAVHQAQNDIEPPAGRGHNLRHLPIGLCLCARRSDRRFQELVKGTLVALPRDDQEARSAGRVQLVPCQVLVGGESYTNARA